jgi:GTP cyclohydrolase I
MSEPIDIKGIRKLLVDLGEDPERDGLKKTPQRFLESMKFLTSGYSVDVGATINDALFDVPYEDMVIVRDIDLYSLCEHHLIPFYGRCHVGYIPSGKVIGLSKIPRIVDAFARRLQVQERLTHEIAAAIQSAIEPQGVGVVIEAYHLCMMMRGVEKQHSFTITSSMQGCFKKMETRAEFMSHVRSPVP